MNCQEYPGSSTRYLGSSPSSPLYHRRSDHLPRLAETTAGPENVIFVLVTTPVLIGVGSSASTVLREGGGGIDLPDEQKKCCSKDVASLLRRMGSLDCSALFMKGLHCSASCFQSSRVQPSDSSLDGEISIRIMLFFRGRRWKFRRITSRKSKHRK